MYFPLKLVINFIMKYVFINIFIIQKKKKKKQKCGNSNAIFIYLLIIRNTITIYILIIYELSNFEHVLGVVWWESNPRL